MSFSQADGMADQEMFGPVMARDQELSFVVFGPTGSGKTTLINYMTAACIEDVNQMKGGEAKVCTDSTTKHISKVSSGKMPKPGLGTGYCTFTFFDTPGHGAKDEVDWMQGSLMASTVKQLLAETGMLNGVILVLKMERFRSDLEDALKEYITMFKKFELDKAAFLVVVTHSLPFTDEIRKAYSKNIATLFRDHTLANNVIHVNVAMLPEMSVDFQKAYRSTIPRELTSFREHLLKNFAKDYNIRHWFDKERGLDKSIDQIFSKGRSGDTYLIVAATALIVAVIAVCR